MHTFDNKAKAQPMWSYGAESPCVQERASQILLSTHGRADGPYPNAPNDAMCQGTDEDGRGETVGPAEKNANEN